MYRYTNHQIPNPYKKPSKIINMNIAYNTFGPNFNVYRIINNVTGSILGRNDIANFPASIVATIMPTKAISLLPSRVFNFKLVLIINRLFLNSIITIFIVYIECPVCSISIKICFYTVNCRNHQSVI